MNLSKYIFRLMCLCLIFVSITSGHAQKGLFVKFSLGPGYVKEYSKINTSAFSYVSKNHAIGWGITDNFAVQFGDFGALLKHDVDGFHYINLDALGVGVAYRTPIDVKVSIVAAYSKVSFAEKWTEATGYNGGKGPAVNITIEKEWFFAKRWSVRLGPQLFWMKTNKTQYKFFNASINGSVFYYLRPLYSKR